MLFHRQLVYWCIAGVSALVSVQWLGLLVHCWCVCTGLCAVAGEDGPGTARDWNWWRQRNAGSHWLGWRTDRRSVNTAVQWHVLILFMTFWAQAPSCMEAVLPKLEAWVGRFWWHNWFRSQQGTLNPAKSWIFIIAPYWSHVCRTAALFHFAV